jgi:hypothetical protein
MPSKRSSQVRSLVLLNAALLAALAGVSFIPTADAQQARVRGQYSMVNGRVQGSTPDGVFIVDGSNMELVASTWDVSRKTLNFIGFRDMRADVANTQARPR